MHRAEVLARAEDILAYQLTRIQKRTDRVFAILFCAQWIFAVGCAMWITPYTWLGADPQAHFHVWLATFLGGLLSAGPILLAWRLPGRFITRMTIAVAQMLYSALLIHLTGGRIETHFHVFGSLAFLAFYRDWRVFVPATAVVAADHLLRGYFWPMSVFGVATAAPWRALEHVGWVLFEDLFLIWATVIAAREMRSSALATAELEDANIAVEEKIDARTRELQEKTSALEDQMRRGQTLELQLLHAQKLESIGQLAAGIAHEINTPMQFVYDNIEFLRECSDKLFHVVQVYAHNLSSSAPQRPWQERAAEVARVIRENHFDRIQDEVPKAIQESLEGIQRVIHIVRAMKEFSHPGHEEKIGVDLNNAVESSVTITRNRWKYAAEMDLDLDPDLPTVNCVPAEINQVMLNLIVNAADSIAEKVGNSGEKGVITIRTRRKDDQIIVEVRDTGCGIPQEIRNRIFDPFFTTKDVGKGTGQGLSICYNVVVNKHGGSIDVESGPGEGTLFRITMPCRPAPSADATADSQPARAFIPCFKG